MKYKMIDLSDRVKTFLKTFTPESDFFTTASEMDLVEFVLQVHKYTQEEDIRALRNSVVDYYSDLMEAEIQYDENGKYISRTDRFWEFNNSMMSVTAVIDNYMYKTIGRV